MRTGAISAGVLLLGAYLVFGGTFDSPRMISLDFGMEPDLLEGCDVEIDGTVVGKLVRHDQSTRMAFEVTRGAHVVRVLHPNFDSLPARVTVRRSGEKARLIVDLTQHYDEVTRSSKTMITMYN